MSSREAEFRRQALSPTRVRYLVAGAVIGGLWAAQSGESPVRMLVRMAVIMILIRVLIAAVIPAVVRRRARSAGRPVRVHVRTGALILAKACLLLGAFALTELLFAVGAGPGASYIVAGLILVVVACFGPLLHPRLFRSEEL